MSEGLRRATIVLGVLTAISTLWLFIIASEVEGHCRELGCLEVIFYSLPAWAGLLMLVLGFVFGVLRPVKPGAKPPRKALVVGWVLLVCLVLAATGFMLVSHYR